MLNSGSGGDGLDYLKDALANASVSFNVFQRSDRPTWTPRWVPSGYSHIAWEIFDPAEMTWFKDDLGARAIAFKSALSRCAEPTDNLLLVFEGVTESLQMASHAVLQNADLILKTLRSWNSPLWVTSPPRQWLVEVSSTMVTVGEPLPADGTLPDCDAVVALLENACIPYSILNVEALGKHELPNIPLFPIIPPLRETLGAQEASRVRDVFLDFLKTRLRSDNLIQLIVPGGCRFHLALHDFLSVLEDLYRGTTGFNVSSSGAAWLIGVRRRTRAWIEAIG